MSAPSHFNFSDSPPPLPPGQDVKIYFPLFKKGEGGVGPNYET